MLHDDATPFFTRFGRLQPELMESATYLVQNGTKWHSVTYADYQVIAGRKRAPTSAGVVEILAVDATSPELGLRPFILVTTNISKIH